MTKKAAPTLNVHSLTQKQLAELFSVTPRSIRDWHSEGLPRLEDGNYDGSACVAWYTDRDGEFADQRQRLAAAQAEKAEAENAVRRGDLADTAVVAVAWIGMIASARAKILAMPGKLGPQVATNSDAAACAALIRTEAYAALSELAGPVREGARSVGAAAGPDDKRVGRRKAKAKQRVERGTGTVAN